MPSKHPFFSSVSAAALVASLLLPVASHAAEIGGYIDAIDSSNNLISNSLMGWAYDPRSPDAAVQVNVYIDDVLAGSASVSLYRPDVGTAMGIDDYHGFRFPIPNSYFDGASHTIRAYSVNQSTGGTTELGGSSYTFSTYDPGVTGYVDAIEQSNPQELTTFAKGWVFDNIDHDAAVPVVAYAGDYMSGAFLGAGAANVSRTDVDEAYDVGAYHGFAVPLDLTGYASGESIHVNVYAIDRTVGELKLISTVAYLVP